MFRRCVFVVAGTVTLLGVVGSPRSLDAQTRKPASTFVMPKASFVPPKPPHKAPPHKVPPHKLPPHKLPPHKLPPHMVPHHPEGHRGEHWKGHPGEHSWGHWGDHWKGHRGEHSWGHWGDHWKGHRGEHPWGHWGDRGWDKRSISIDIRERFSASFFAVGSLFSGVVAVPSVVGVPGAGVLPTGIPTGGSSAVSSGSDALVDTAAIMRAYADIIKANEEARILREEAEGLRLDKLKKKAETNAYIESLTPSWTQMQAKIDREILAHAQSATNLFEITSGRALNTLLADLRKTTARKIPVNSGFLGEEILGHINITTKNGNLGLLRNDGAFTWPQALISEDIVSDEDRGEIKVLARALIRSKGNFPRTMLEDLDRVLVRTEKKLASKVNDIPAAQYLQAKRFLNDFQAARIALENGEGAAYFKFQKWVRGGRTIREVADYLVREGLQFASAVPGDEAAYRAVHSALAAYNVAVNTRPSGSIMTSNQ